MRYDCILAALRAERYQGGPDFRARKSRPVRAATSLQLREPAARSVTIDAWDNPLVFSRGIALAIDSFQLANG